MSSYLSTVSFRATLAPTTSRLVTIHYLMIFCFMACLPSRTLTCHSPGAHHSVRTIHNYQQTYICLTKRSSENLSFFLSFIPFQRHSFIFLFVWLVVRSFICSFVHSFVYLFICSSVRLFISLFVWFSILFSAFSHFFLITD